MYQLETTVRLHDTDAAGLLFFANQFTMAHDCYESWMADSGLSFLTILVERDYLLPIVHAEADFAEALEVGQELVIELTAGRIGNSSFTLNYRLTSDDVEVGSVSTVHVCVDAETGEKRDLPDELVEILEEL